MNRDPRIDAYIERAQPFARPILEHVRMRVHAVAPEAEETLKWGMPAFTCAGKILLTIASFKAHAALNFWRGSEISGKVVDPRSMGQFGKLAALEDLPDDDKLDTMIRTAVELSKAAPRPRQKKAPKPPPEMHPEFAAALVKAPKARAEFDAFPPSAQRDYLEWIAEAKQGSTRQKRIATAIEWLSEGKRRHWKYERS